MVAELIVWIEANGYMCTFGEAYRNRETALYYQRRGLGISNSLHCDRLAIDLNLFKDGRYLVDSDDYRDVGLFWESIGGAWGGRFSDGNHFSLPVPGDDRR